jgi:hypothetical protein
MSSEATADYPSRSGLQIDDRSTSHLLAISWSGPPYRHRLRQIASLILLVAAVYWGRLAHTTWLEFQGNRFQRDSAPILAAVLVCLLFLAHSLASFVAHVVAYWRELIWDETERTFVARRRGWLWYGNRTITIPFDRMRSLHLDLGREGRGAIGVKLRIYEKDSLSSIFDADLTSLGFIERRLAQGFIFTLGRIVQAIGYTVSCRSIREYTFRLWMTPPPKEEDDEEDRPKPFPPLGTIVEPPFTNLAALALQRFRSFDPNKTGLEFTRVEEWSPGKRVRLVRTAMPLMGTLFCVGFVAGLGALAGAFPVWGVLHDALELHKSTRTFVTAFMAFAAGVFVYFMIRNNLRLRTWSFDWTTKRLTMQDEANYLDRPFSEIIALLFVRMTRRRSSSGDSTGATEYGARVELLLPDQEVVLLQSEAWSTNSNTPENLVGPFAQDLAAGLGVPCVRDPYGARATEDLLRAFRFRPGQIAFFIALAAVAVVWMVSVYRQNRHVQQAAEELRSFGIDVVKMGSYGINKDIVCENYWELKMTSRTPLVDHGERVHELLLQLSHVGLKAEGANFVDGDLEPFRGVPMCVVDVSRTRLTDAGLEPLATASGLVYFNVEQTQAGDATCKVLSRQPNLRYAHLSRTRVTGDGAAELRRALPGLQLR